MSKKTLRPPAIPLVTVDPYFSIWSFDETLTGDFTRHWTGVRNTMTGIVKIDGKTKRFMGKTETNAIRYSREMEALNQTGVCVKPLSTVYEFEDDTIMLKVIFWTPLLCDDISLMSRPVSYIAYEIKSKDDKQHDIEIYFDISAEAAVDTIDQEVCFKKTDFSVCCGRGEHDIHVGETDDNRIDWGWLHMFGADFEAHMIDYSERKEYIRTSKKEFSRISQGQTCKVDITPPVLCLIKTYKLKDSINDFICVGYDDIYSIEYNAEKLVAYWKKDSTAFDDVAKDAVKNYDSIYKKVTEFENNLIKNATEISPKYCDIISLAYRQVVAAHKAVWDGEKVLFFSKECYSGGYIGTVDVTYPSIPMFLLFNPDLVKGMIDPIFEYSASHQWNFDYAPHDIGRYPIANGMKYGYDEKRRILTRKMPVEECGNMLLITAALCYRLKSADYALKHKEMLQKWANYLVEYGYMPEMQICTDDFAGPLAYNCNLSVKAIMGIAAWGMLLNMMGYEDEAEKYTSIAKEYAYKWKKDAFDTDHYRLAFDVPDTWSIKYNLMWDKLLKLNIFDEDIFKTETEYYMTKINRYGLPLDCRKGYGKSDWNMWSTIFGDECYRNKIIDAMWDMLCDTCDRVPFTDWYETDTAEQCHDWIVPIQAGFQNRSVQGGLFINLLEKLLN